MGTYICSAMFDIEHDLLPFYTNAMEPRRRPRFSNDHTKRLLTPGAKTPHGRSAMSGLKMFPEPKAKLEGTFSEEEAKRIIGAWIENLMDYEGLSVSPILISTEDAEPGLPWSYLGPLGEIDPQEEVLEALRQWKDWVDGKDKKPSKYIEFHVYPPKIRYGRIVITFYPPDEEDNVEWDLEFYED